MPIISGLIELKECRRYLLPDWTLLGILKMTNDHLMPNESSRRYSIEMKSFLCYERDFIFFK